MNDQELDEIRRRMQESLIDAKREELREQYGMQLDNLDSSLLSPEAKNEWLDSVIEFERQFENAQTITVRERIGNPTIRPVDEIPRTSWKKWWTTCWNYCMKTQLQWILRENGMTSLLTGI